LQTLSKEVNLKEKYFLIFKSSKLYILIDEYDYSVNKALRNAQYKIQKELYAHDEEDSTYEEQQSLFKRFFSEIKTKLGEGGVGRVFITGVSPIALYDSTSGFNISKHITFAKKFEGMCGVLESEIRDALEQIIPSDKSLQEEAMKVMRDNYDGYKFNSKQETSLYNTTLVIYFLRDLKRLNKIPSDLIDPNVQPSESALDIIIKSPLSKEIINKLFSNSGKFYHPQKISSILATKKMSQLLQTDTLYILSFLYYMGVLTQSKLSDDKTGTEFRIPNKLIESELASFKNL
jgi:hypothetical protein